MAALKLSRHPSGRAFCRFRGKFHYFGEYGTEESQTRFRQWLETIEVKSDGRRDTTVLVLIARFLTHAKIHYRKNGEQTGECENFVQALRPLGRLYGNCIANDFGPKMLKVLQQQMIADDLCRNSVNARIRRIRHVFRWGVSEEIVLPSVLTALAAVQGLDYGRTEARETDPVRPVPELDFLAIEPNVSRQVWGLARFMKLTGARPSEAVLIRWCDIDAEGEVWRYEPSRHKTQHKRLHRVIAIGPRAQAVLMEFKGKDQDYVFRPQQALSEFVAANYRRGSKARTVGEFYSVHGLRSAIRVACVAAGVTVWSPNQLRHNAATEMRRLGGLDVAQVGLGHASAKTTETYADVNVDVVLPFAKLHG